jgi:hypothetical protein
VYEWDTVAPSGRPRPEREPLQRRDVGGTVRLDEGGRKLERHTSRRPSPQRPPMAAIPDGPGVGLVGERRVPKLAVHALLLIIPLWVASLYWNGELFGYHATFMSLGFMLFMSEGGTPVHGNPNTEFRGGEWLMGHSAGVWLASRAVVLPPGEDRLNLLKLHMVAQVNETQSNQHGRLFGSAP